MPSSDRQNQSSAGKTMILVLFLTFGVVRTATAYVDPNSAGPLFQMLFPLFVAVASMLAMVRGVLKRAWNRAVYFLMSGIFGRTLGVKPDDPP